MQNPSTQAPIAQLQAIRTVLSDHSTWPTGLSNIQAIVRTCIDTLEGNELEGVEPLLQIIDDLVDVLMMIHADPDQGSEIATITQFCRSAIDAIDNEFHQPTNGKSLSQLCRHASNAWGAYLSDGDAESFDAWEENQTSNLDRQTPSDPPEQDDAQIGLILGALGAISDSASQTVANEGVERTDASERGSSETTIQAPEPFATVTDGELELTPPAPESIALDQETISAYADDAIQCVSVIETEVLRYEQDPNSLDALRQICRELHTIKGASAAIGLSQLAGFLHRVEDSLEQNCDAAARTDVEVVLQSVDAVRSQLEVLVTASSNHQQSQSGSSDLSVDSSIGVRTTIDTSAAPDSIRVNAGQLDRIFDMLAELVMLRNRRDSSVDNLKRVNAELLHCVTRLRTFAEHSPEAGKRSDLQSIPVESMTEIASDLLELGRTLRQTIDPITEENTTLSRFIDHFRSEMIELRRLPIKSLFIRLQRPIRDAAKVEGKQVHVEFVNDQHGLERSLHEKLYEPLMHVVRNAVSHGIESVESRVAQGKPEHGTITISAHSGSNLFVVEVRDDGKGINYDAVQQRAIERGLINPTDQLSNEEIANLIFRPGFSTRDEVSEVSGRGVGMDVVAASLDELQGWVELESRQGEGTCIRLLVPRNSFIENVLVFRLGNQFFAFPTRHVTLFKDDARPAVRKQTEIHLTQLLGTQRGGTTDHLTPLRLSSHDHPDRDTTVWVDEIIGTEEVVTRPLPPLLNTQRMVCGVTLSGSGDVLLLLNADSILAEERSEDRIEVHPIDHKERNTDPVALSVENPGQKDTLGILVAEDSVTARLTLCRMLRQICHCEIFEAKDGADAFSLFKTNRDRIDLIFTDIDMPRMTGFDLLRELQVIERTEPVPPVTVLSSRGDQRSRDTAIQFGAFQHLTKPANETAIKRIIDRVNALGAPTA